MGHLVSFAAIRGLTEPSPLHGIEPSIPWRAHRLPGSDLVLIEWLQRPNRNNPPPHNQLRFPSPPDLGIRPAGIAFKTGFGAAAPGLDELYARLQSEKRAGTLPAVAVHVALMLHRLVALPILSLCSDDDEWDLACEVREGQIDRLDFRAGEEEIKVGRDGRIETLPSPQPSGQRIHKIAEEAAVGWSEKLQALFGFDGDVARLGLQELDRVNFVPEPPAENAWHVQQARQEARQEAPRKPFWKFWS